jgi:hypothetical protein
VNEPVPGPELEQLAELLRSRARAEASEGERRMQRATFMARVDSTLIDPRRAKHKLFWAIPALAAAALLYFTAVHSPRRALSFEVAGAARDGDYVRASNAPAKLTFSDQTTVLGAPGARLRVEAMNERGARVLVERGHADVHVQHRTSTAWTFVAGPFEVAVTGTRFALDWDPTHETLELALLEGSVEVRGAAGTGPWSVRAGQRFLGDVQRASMRVSDLRDDGQNAPSSVEVSKTPAGVDSAMSAEPTLTTPEASTTPEPVTTSEPPHAAGKADSWEQRMARGEFAQIVAAAEARGTTGCLTSCSASDLRALSDAARYTGKVELAQQSLLALRKRFGRSQGRDAAFLLGRLEERRGALAAAISWYDTYLREAPGGAFAAEALAGKMRAVRSASGVAAAAPLARTYLERFPKGVHVNTAREILAGK